MEINAKMVKDLRECTGAGMMDCKNALTEAKGDMDTAVDILRTKGLAALAKKAGRATNEGVIGGWTAKDGNSGALVEINCETDFVARNADFRTFVDGIAAHVGQANPADMEQFMAAEMTGRDIAVEQVIGETVGKLGENIVVARFARYELGSDAGAVTVYIHGVGNIGVMVEIAAGSSDAASSAEFAALSKDIAMQITAAAPYAVSRDGVPADIVEHEKSIFKAQAAESGKPEQIQDKVAEGRLEKFFKEVALLEQQFVKDQDITVREHLERTAKALATEITVVRFERMVLGETAPGDE